MALDLDLRWSDLAQVGRSRILRSSLIWVVVTPMIARVLEGANSVLKFEIFGEIVPISLSLPFSFKASYMAACCFSLASLIYTVRCPWILARFDSYTHFQNEGRGTNDLVDQAAALAQIIDGRSSSEGENTEAASKFLLGLAFAAGREGEAVPGMNLGTDGSKTDPAKSPLRSRIISNRAQRELLQIREGLRRPEAFTYIRDAFDQEHPAWRRTLVALYGAGFCLTTLIFAQNAWMVFN